MVEKIIIKDYFLVKQPINSFYVCRISPEDLLQLSNPDPREYNEELDKYLGIQREIDTEKIRSLKDFIKTNDACIPNSIIGSLDPMFVLNQSEEGLEIATKINSSNRKPIFIIDGQHRILSFKNTNYEKPFDLILTLFVGIDVPIQAYLFSTINSRQKKLNPSLVQDLNELFTLELPEKIVHVMVSKGFNSKPESPWHNLIKPLGKKDANISDGVMSQYSFSKPIINLIYDERNNYKLRKYLDEAKNNRLNLNYYEDKIFWESYKNKNEKVIYRYLSNFFSAFKTVYSDEWGNNSFILTKTTGYNAMILFFEFLYKKKSATFFESINELNHLVRLMSECRYKLDTNVESDLIISDLKSTNYESGAQGQKKLYFDLVKAYKQVKKLK